METVVVNKLNECLKLLNITNIKFKYSYTSKPKRQRRIEILFPKTSSYEFDAFAWFNSVDDVFKRSTKIYNDVSELRNICLSIPRNPYYCAYHILTSTDIKFLEILSTCSSLEELELKIAIYMGQ